MVTFQHQLHKTIQQVQQTSLILMLLKKNKFDCRDIKKHIPIKHPKANEPFDFVYINKLKK